MATFDCAMCHNLKLYKWTIIMDGGDQYFHKAIHPKIAIMLGVRFWWINEK